MTQMHKKVRTQWIMVLLIASIALPNITHAQNQNTGYEIKLDIKPYQNQWVYLAYHYGKLKGLADSAYLDANSRGVFKGSTALSQGIYIVASPNKSILFEMLVADDQQFNLKLDTANRTEMVQYDGSQDNNDFVDYTNFIAPKAQSIEASRVILMDSAQSELSKKSANDKILGLNKDLIQYREDYIKAHPDMFLTALFKSMRETQLPDNLKMAKTRADTMAQYYYRKNHYWDDIDLMDGRLVRTPILENKVQDYLNNWVSQDADSVITEFNWMIALGRNDKDMFRYLISYFVDHYMYPKVMGQDKVFLHVYNRYIGAEEAKVDWLNETQLKTIRERAYMVMANQLGAKAWDMALLDTSGKTKKMYDIQADYTVVAFWDVHCGKCKEDLPIMHGMYNDYWKKHNVKIYAVMVNEESVKEWPKFISENAPGWTHVHETANMRNADDAAGRPNFRQLYDMRSTPTLYLLDKNKNIIAKNIGLVDLNELLKRKIAGTN